MNTPARDKILGKASVVRHRRSTLTSNLFHVQVIMALGGYGRRCGKKVFTMTRFISPLLQLKLTIFVASKAVKKIYQIVIFVRLIGGKGRVFENLSIHKKTRNIQLSKQNSRIFEKGMGLLKIDRKRVIVKTIQFLNEVFSLEIIKFKFY